MPMPGRVLSLTLICVIAAVLGTATAAFAQSSPAQSVYSPGGNVLNVVQGGGPTPTPTPTPPAAPTPTPVATPPSSPPATTASGSLPFTGFQAGLVGLAGLALLGSGVAMRRFTRRSDS
jgi:hypothetical protein